MINLSNETCRECPAEDDRESATVLVVVVENSAAPLLLSVVVVVVLPFFIMDRTAGIDAATLFILHLLLLLRRACVSASFEMIGSSMWAIRLTSTGCLLRYCFGWEQDMG